MNLLVFLDHEVKGSIGWVRAERAEHVRSVLGKKPGDTLRVAVNGRGRGVGTLVQDSDEGIAVQLGELEPDPPPLLHLIIALPRPLGLSRLLHTAASFGVGHIDLIRAWKVPRSYFHSPRLDIDRRRDDLRLGAEQGRQSFVPTSAVHDGFRKFVEDVLPLSANLAQVGRRFVLDPEAAAPFPSPLLADTPLSLAFGPEGGFLPQEVESFFAAGFSPITLGTAILTTEIAVAASLAQLALLHRQALSSSAGPEQLGRP